MNLFVDIETTGLVQYGMGWERDYKRFPYVVSLAWNHNGVTKEHILYQQGREIPEQATAIHGISTEMGNDRRLTSPPTKVYKEFITDALEAGNIIGHNLYFDISIIKANVLRQFTPKSKWSVDVIEALNKDKRIDTMRAAHKYFKGKWPKLTELHERLFKEDFEDAHGAKADMLACKRCFEKMVQMKII